MYCKSIMLPEMNKKLAPGRPPIEWPIWIFGESIKAHFAEKQVGEVDCWNGVLNDQPKTVFCFKDPDYVMSIMSTYGTVNEEFPCTKNFVNPSEHRQNKSWHTYVCYSST
jgi:hypothetical protein